MSLFASVRAPTAYGAFVPRIRLFTETVFLDDGLSEAELELTAGVLSLDFDYLDDAAHDDASERNARYILESFGVTEIDSIGGCAVVPGSRAQYLIQTSVNVQRLCEFTVFALPQLRQLGWRVEIDDDHDWQVVNPPSWFAHVTEQSGRPDWFDLELGVEIGGERVNLLPALIALLESPGGVQSLARPGRRFVPLRVSDKGYVTVPFERLECVLAVVAELYHGEFGRSLHRARLPLLRKWVDSDDEIALVAAPAVMEAAQAPSLSDDVIAVKPPSGLVATLRPYQLEGLAWLQFLRERDVGGILADDMGLGKTLQVIAHLLTEKNGGRVKAPALVVAPTSLIANWQREFRRFAPTLSVVALHGPKRDEWWPYVRYSDVVVTSYPILVRDQARFEDHEFGLLVLDEAQTIKNSSAKVHRAARSVPCRSRLCMSGTPVENNLRELWSLVDFCTPGFLGGKREFQEEYVGVIDRDDGEERLERLRKRVAPLILRRTKAGVVKDLPPKTELVRAVELSGRQRDLYESIRMSAHSRVRKTIAKSGLAASTIAILDALMKLRQVCCDPRLLRMDSAREVQESAKYKMLFELLDMLLSQGHRPLVFSQFTSMLSLISSGLAERGVEHSLLTGSTRDRQRQVDDFESRRTGVFLISLKAGGTGLNLTSADAVIHYDPWWNPAAQQQATDRAYRIGQKNPVFVYNLIVAGSVEERMLGLQRKKRMIADAILGSQRSGLDAADVEDLFLPLG